MFSLIRDFGKQDTRRNAPKISVSLACYWQIGSKSTNYSHWCDLLTFSTSCYWAVIGGFRSDLSITRKTDRNFGNTSVGVLFSKVTYQRKWWWKVNERPFLWGKQKLQTTLNPHCAKNIHVIRNAYYSARKLWCLKWHNDQKNNSFFLWISKLC